MATRMVRGHFSKRSDPAFGEATECAGFDFGALDLEHGQNNVLSLIGEALDVRLFTGKCREIVASLAQ